MSFFISRQRYYDDNVLAVEIACEGSKHAGEDILPFKFAGEDKNLVSPVDAVNVAVRIIGEWNLSYFDERKFIALVNSDGKGGKLYFDPFSKKDIANLERWGQQEFARLPKCDNCGRCIGNKANAYEMVELPNKVYCDERCLSTTYRHFYGKEPPRVQSNKGKKKAP
jgi:hypothetical protein